MQANMLVVDDEKPIRDMASFALRQSDFQCSQAASAEDARDNICKTRLDIITKMFRLVTRHARCPFHKHLPYAIPF